MSVPAYPTIHISPSDLSGFNTSKHTKSSSITVQSGFTSQFSVVSNVITKVDKLIQLSLVATKINGHMLLNTTLNVGIIPPGFRPISNVSGTFPYILFIGDIGAMTIDTNGNISIRSGDNAYIADTTTITVSIMYLSP